MSRGKNKVELLGNLCADPELRFSGAGVAVCNMRLATNEQRYDKASKEWKDHTEFHRLVAFGKKGETIADKLGIGDPILIEGSLQTRSWEKDGQTRSSTEVVVNEFWFVGGGRSQGGNQAGGSSPARQSPSNTPPPASDLDDDIPF